MEMTKAKVPTGPVKRQVAEAWNHQRTNISCGMPKQEMEIQYENIKTPRTCKCCEYYDHPCLQEEDSLMTAEARQRYQLDINKKRKSFAQDPILERVTQDEDTNQTMNLEDWSISFKEFQPNRIKQHKKQSIQEGHYINKGPTKRKMTRSRDAGLYCLKCGEDGHLASWCEKEDDSPPQNQSSNSLSIGQPPSVGLLVSTDDLDIPARKECHQSMP
ncbi:unnamed protein product [Urochloa humidicola]